MTLIVNINSKVREIPSSNLTPIGQALKALSDLHHNGAITTTSKIDCIDLGYSGPGEEQIEKIAVNTSISEVEKIAVIAPIAGAEEDAPKWEFHGAAIGRTPEALSGVDISVKFVFEKENEMIFVVRDAGALDFGLYDGAVANQTPAPAVGEPPSTAHPTFEQSPPMNEGEYLLETEDVRAVCEAFQKKIAADIKVTDGEELAEKVDNAGSRILEDFLPALDKSTKDRIFYQQLGAYSVRQCS